MVYFYNNYFKTGFSPDSTTETIDKFYINLVLMILKLFVPTPLVDSSSFHNSKKNRIFFVILVAFEIFSRHPYIVSSHLLIEDVQWIIDSFQRNAYGLNGFDTFFLHFLAFACICCFHNQKTYCDVLLMTYD